jgi:hypothetical protein
MVADDVLVCDICVSDLCGSSPGARVLLSGAKVLLSGAIP